MVWHDLVWYKLFFYWKHAIWYTRILQNMYPKAERNVSENWINCKRQLKKWKKRQYGKIQGKKDKT